MCFKIDWAIRIVGSNFTVFALFYFVFEGIFQCLYLEGLINGGLIFGILRYSSVDQNTSCIYIYLKLSFKTSKQIEFFSIQAKGG